MLSDKVRIKCMYKRYAEFAVIDFNLPYLYPFILQKWGSKGEESSRLQS